jgi:hypothetical protein
MPFARSCDDLLSGNLGTSIDLYLADARQKPEICRALAGCAVVVKAIGAGTLRGNNVESTTTAIAIAAAEELVVESYIAMSAGMVALDWIVFKYVLRPLIFRNIFAEHCRVEDLVRTSSAARTIIRPPKLTNGPPKRNLASCDRGHTPSRAAFIADELDKKEYVRKAVSSHREVNP